MISLCCLISLISGQRSAISVICQCQLLRKIISDCPLREMTDASNKAVNAILWRLQLHHQGNYLIFKSSETGYAMVAQAAALGGIHGMNSIIKVVV